MERRRLSWLDVLVLTAIAGAVIGVPICGLAILRERAKRMECTNNLRQLALGFRIWEDSNGVLPTENGPTASPFYVQLMPYLEATAVPPSSSPPIKLFLCPARRTTAMAPGMRDYAYAATNGFGSAGKSILDTPGGTTLTAIERQSGTANTLLLSHRWMDPRTYTGGDSTDIGWGTATNNSRSINDTARHDRDPNGSIYHIGSPHPQAMPSAFADAHVQDIPYDYASWAELWAWDRTPQDLPPP
jgi:hypothetical protein